MRNCLINENKIAYDYYNEQTDRTTLQRYSNCKNVGE